MNLKSIISILFALAIALTAFGATYWFPALGYLAESPGVLLLAAILPLAIIALTLERKPSGITVMTWLMLTYGVVVSVLSGFIFGWDSFYFAKAGVLLIFSIIWISPLLYMDFVKASHMRWGLAAALLICAFAYVFSDLNPGAIPESIRLNIFGLDYRVYSDARPRGFMTETSHFGTLVGRYLLLLFLMTEHRKRYSAMRLSLFLLVMTAVLGLIGSKGGAISALVTIAAVTISWRQAPYLVFLAPLGWWVGLQQYQAVTSDIEKFTSSSTRLTLWVASLVGMGANPLGYGYYGFYGAIQHFGGWSINLLGRHFVLIFHEVIEIINSLSNVSTKSTLLDFGLMFGLFFVWLMISIVRQVDLKDPRARAGLVYLFLTAVSSSGHESISFFLGLAALLQTFPKKQPPRPIATPGDGAIGTTAPTFKNLAPKSPADPVLGRGRS